MPMTKAVRLLPLMNSSQRRWQTLARNKETKIELTAYDDLFETDQGREDAKLGIFPFVRLTSFQTIHSRL